MSLMVSVSGVRGIVGADLDPPVILHWVTAFGAVLRPGPVVVGRDSRVTGEALSGVAVSCLRAMGREVWDLGIVLTPTVQMAVEHWGASGGLILSASHNPGEWNALKFVDGDGSFLLPHRFEELRARHESGPAGYARWDAYGPVRERRAEALEMHCAAILEAVDHDAIRRRGLKVSLDTGHGAAGALLPLLAERLGVSLDGRNLETNGRFAPNPEPNAETLPPFLDTVKADVAFAAMIDPDGDRLAIGIPGTAIASEEWTLPLVAAARLAGSPAGQVLITNLSTSSRLESVAARHDAEVLRTPVGEAHVVGAMRQHRAALGGEGNGGVIDPQVHLGRDAAVAFARLCEVEATVPGGLKETAAAFPPRVMRKEKFELGAAGEPGAAGLQRYEAALTAVFGEPQDRRDGLRWSFEDGFVHLRCSNTEPVIRGVIERGSAERVSDGAAALRKVFREVH